MKMSCNLRHRGFYRALD